MTVNEYAETMDSIMRENEMLRKRLVKYAHDVERYAKYIRFLQGGQQILSQEYNKLKAENHALKIENHILDSCVTSLEHILTKQ